MTTSTRKIGDRVMVTDSNYPGIWVIESFGPKNTMLRPEGGGRGLRAPHYMVTDVDEDRPAPPPQQFFVIGEFVRIESGKFTGLYVVIADKGGDRVTVARAGGDADRYVRVARSGLVKVDASEVLR